MRVVGYTREGPAAAGGRPAFSQGEDIRRFCAEHGHQPIAVCADVHSPSGDDNRFGFHAVLAVLDADPAAHVVVASLEALAPDLVEQEALIAEITTRGRRILSADPADDKELSDEPATPERRDARRMVGRLTALRRSID